MKFIKLFSLLCFLTYVPSAMALSNGWYGSVGMGWSHAFISKSDTVPNARSVDRNALGYKAMGGFQFAQNFAVEGNYFFFNRFRYKSTTAGTANGSFRAQALALNVVGILPLAQRFGTKVKVGVYNTFVSRSGGLMFSSSKDKPRSEFGVNYGLSAYFTLNKSFDVMVGYDQLLRNPKYTLISANIAYHFGV